MSIQSERESILTEHESSQYMNEQLGKNIPISNHEINNQLFHINYYNITILPPFL